MNLTWIADPETWIALVTLVALELVLGVDNIIFISILSGKLPPAEQPRARTTGILLAVVTRILLLAFLYVIAGLTEPLFTIPVVNIELTGKSLVLLAGGLFLLWKSTHEIHEKLEGQAGGISARTAANFVGVVVQIMILDIVFSLDSVITAVGMVKHIEIMVLAVVLAAIVMIFVAGPIGDFVERHPTVKMLALSFLLMIGFTLVAEAFHVEIPKGYIYFAMGFSVMVEALNLRVRAQSEPVSLRQPFAAAPLKPHPAALPVDASAPGAKSAAKKPKSKSPAKKSAAPRKRSPR